MRFRAEAGHRYVVPSREGLLAPRIERPVPLDPAGRREPGGLPADRAARVPARGGAVACAAGEPGLTTMAVAFEEIAEVFGQGQPKAEAIRDFLAYAYHSWSRPSPRYVVLLGDASYDPRHFLTTSWVSPLPALWAKTSYLWTVSDPALAAVNGTDAIPDLAIGRLPAQTPAEAEALVSKLLDVGGLGPGPRREGGPRRGRPGHGRGLRGGRGGHPAELPVGVDHAASEAAGARGLRRGRRS